MNLNFIDEDILAGNSVSSEQSSFPVTNAFNQQRRSKVWRSNGYWRITDDNRVLKFDDGGSALTANLTKGEYTSTALFMAEIKAAMELVGVNTYTITQSGIFKFNFASSGGTFTLTFTGSTLAGDIGLTSDKTGSTSYTMDKVIVHQQEWLEFDLGIETNPDAFILIDQRNDPIHISPTATVTLQANETGEFDGTFVGYEQVITHDDEVFSVISDDGLADTGYRYWRIKFEDKENPLGYIQIGAFFLGNYLSPVRGRAQFPLSQNFIDRTVTVFSEGGQSFADIKEKSERFSVQIKALQKADVEEFRTMFNDFGTGKPFFISMDSGEVFSSDYQRYVRLVKFDSEPRWRLISPDNFTLDLSLREEL
jgi:hypothetical protein